MTESNQLLARVGALGDSINRLERDLRDSSRKNDDRHAEVIGMRADVRNMKDTVDRLVKILHGNGDGSIVTRVAQHADRIENLCERLEAFENFCSNRQSNKFQIGLTILAGVFALVAGAFVFFVK